MVSRRRYRRRLRRHSNRRGVYKSRRSSTRRSRRSRSRKIARLPINRFKRINVVKLRYDWSAVVAESGTSGGQTKLNSFRTNSVYDPDYTGVGASVQNFTEWAAKYNNYEVLSSKITYTLVPNGANMLGAVFLTKIDDDDSSFTTARNYNLWASDPNVKMKMFSLSADTPFFKFSRKWSHRRQFSGAMAYFNGASTSGNPNTSSFFNAAVQMANLTAVTPTFTMHVQIDYLVKFTNPKDSYNP